MRKNSFERVWALSICVLKIIQLLLYLYTLQNGAFQVSELQDNNTRNIAINTQTTTLGRLPVSSY